MSFPVPIDFSRPILVLTDFDGTLAPIVDRPEDARAEPVCRAALVRLHRAAPGMVRVVTGREVSVFDTLINDGVAVEDQLVLPVYGGHGTQQRDANGRIGALDMSV
ncbi:MAG: hypothetical protein U9N14_04975, partial [Pseudomonadota bacterium]|nr:hypothetical protein [Pseudomonadota bacterium]